MASASTTKPTTETKPALPAATATQEPAATVAAVQEPEKVLTRDEVSAMVKAGATAAVATAGTAAPAYGLDEVIQTIDLCMLASPAAKIGLLAEARAMIAAKTPIAKVCERLTATKAAAADSSAAEIVATAPAPVVNAGWDEVVNKVNAQMGFVPKR